jgi:ssDNA-binding Zn-finger/Zn-ribbon topoisomerase 1
MRLLMSKSYGPFYGCTRFPECRGVHGAYPDGRPRGVPGDKATRRARIRAHKVFDLLWKDKRMTRPKAYAWMRKAMKLKEDEAHIGMFTVQQCEQLIDLVHRKFPGSRTIWDRLRYNPFSETPEDVDPDIGDKT